MAVYVYSITSKDHPMRLDDVHGVGDPPSPLRDFGGRTMHSVEYVDPSLFRGKRVLVVGLGNSGADIACDAAANADAAFISTRRGYHFVPKHVFGMPSDETEWLPIWAERLVYGVVTAGRSRPRHPRG